MGGERASAQWLARRLREIGVSDVVESRFRTQSSWAPANLAHVAMGMLTAVLPGLLARLAAAAVAVSYELDVSGRNQWVRRLLPAATGVSVSATIEPAGRPARTLVLVAHHDAAHNGLVWHPRTIAASRAFARRTGHTIPSHALVLGVLTALALPIVPARHIARAALAGAGLLMVQSMRSRTAPGANDNATGVAVVLELARRLRANPLPDTRVVLVFPGGEEAGSTGMRAWLRRYGTGLDPRTTLAVNLDAVGSGGHLVVARREGLTGRLDPADVQLAVQAADRAGIDLRPVSIPNPTDGATAKQAGLHTISLLSLNDGWISHLHLDSDTVDNVGWSTVEDAVRLTEHITAVWREESKG